MKIKKCLHVLPLMQLKNYKLQCTKYNIPCTKYNNIRCTIYKKLQYTILSFDASITYNVS